MRVIALFSRALLILSACGLLLLLLRPPRVIDVDAPTYDPAIEAESKTHTADFGGVDRWTFPGMENGLLVNALITAGGYNCPAVQDVKLGGTPKSGVHQQVCTRHRVFPLPRDLVVEASVAYGQGGRLTGIKAYSRDASDNALVQSYARLLRSLNLIEPATLTVKGLSFSSSADLARYVVDAIKPGGWHDMCDRVTLDFEPQCKYMAERRHNEGFPAIGAQPLAVSLSGLIQSLESIGIRALIITMSVSGAEIISPRWNDDSLPIRVEGETLWLDLRGRDFTGAIRLVSVQLAAQGATPLSLNIRQGDSAPVSVAVKGIPRNTDLIVPGDYR